MLALNEGFKKRKKTIEFNWEFFFRGAKNNCYKDTNSKRVAIKKQNGNVCQITNRIYHQLLKTHLFLTQKKNFSFLIQK